MVHSIYPLNFLLSSLLKVIIEVFSAPLHIPYIQLTCPGFSSVPRDVHWAALLGKEKYTFLF